MGSSSESQILAEGYPPVPLLRRPEIAELDALMEDTCNHPERFPADRYRPNA